MAIKHILLDADGLLIKKHRYFSEIYAEQNNLSYEELLKPFFYGPFIECEKGELDLKTSIEPHLQSWKWSSGVDAFVDEWLTTTTFLDQEFAAFLPQIKSKGVKLHLASNQEKYRADYLTKLLSQLESFDNYFYSHKLGYMKDSPEFFTKLLETIEALPKETLFFDDDERNILIAKKVGINAHLFTNLESLTNDLQRYNF